MADRSTSPDSLEPDSAVARAAASTGDEPDIGTFYPWPVRDDAVRDALARAWADGSWGRYHGPHCDRLRTELSVMHGIEHVTLCSSGTIAVELALRGLRVTAEDEVILAGYDFPGNFRAIEALGARPVLVDIDPRTWCLDPTHLAGAVSPQTRAIVVSHLHGGIAAMEEIMAFAAERGLRVVEDACQAPLAKVDGRIAGTLGDVGVLSFGGSKLLTAGRGGALLSRHADVEQRIKVFTHRGNEAFPLSELQAAVLLPQLALLHKRNQQRRANVQRILSGTARFAGLRPVQNRAGAEPSFYKLAWLWQPGENRADVSRGEFLARGRTERIPIDAGFRGFARRSARRCRAAGSLQHSSIAAAQTVVLHHPVLLAGEADLDQMTSRLVALVDQLFIGKV
jgi:perosamine synthetase